MSLPLNTAADPKTRLIPKSIVQRALEGVRYAITGVAPDNWFGPMQPLAPMAPAEVAGRRFDYPTGYNLNYGPRAYEPVSFADLRALADNCDILRLVIETRKDQIEAQDWDIRPKKGASGARPRASQFANDIAAAKTFFAFPDREHDFAQWTRQIAEEMFVTDATSLFKRRDRKGRVCAFEIIDGATIAPRIDQWGRAPQPPDVAYQQILHGVPAADYARSADAGLAQMTTDELVYYPRNKRPGHVYGQSPVEQIILTANIVLRRSLHQLAYYTDGNLTDAVFTAPSGWTADQIHTWQTFWNSLFAGNLRERRHGTWVPDGTKYVPLKDIVLKDAFDEYLARIVCFCFSISPQPFVAQVNRATAETAKAQATEEGLAPVLAWFKRLFDMLIQRHLGCDALEFVWIDDREMDPSAADAIDVADVKAGIRTINEVRMARGLSSLPGGDRLMVATGAGYVPITQTAKPQAAPAGKLAKLDPYHWPAHAPDSAGGRFAPKGEGDGSDTGSLDDAVYHPQGDSAHAERASDTSSPSLTIGEGPLHQVKAPLHTFQLEPSTARDMLLGRAVTSQAGQCPTENDRTIDAVDPSGKQIVLKDETGAAIPGSVYKIDGTDNGRYVETVNAYAAAAPGTANGEIGAMKFFTTRAALNDFLSANPGWGEKFGNTDANARVSRIFAGAVNPGWENDPSFKPSFVVKGQTVRIAIPADKLATVIYWHELGHQPPTSFPGTDEGEERAWEYGFHHAGIDF